MRSTYRCSDFSFFGRSDVSVKSPPPMQISIGWRSAAMAAVCGTAASIAATIRQVLLDEPADTHSAILKTSRSHPHRGALRHNRLHEELGLAIRGLNASSD